jgi:hypothetical protein
VVIFFSISINRCKRVVCVQGGDYFAIVVNYGIIGLAVFTGSFTQSTDTKGTAASAVSLASFYLIMLMNSLTTILDATKQLGEVAGHTARICSFMQQMDSIATCAGRSPQRRTVSPFSPRIASSLEGSRHGSQTLLGSPAQAADVAAPSGQGRSAFRRVMSDTLKRRRPPSEELDLWHSNEALATAFGGILPEYLKHQASTLLPPTNGTLAEGGTMEFSIHQLGTQELGEIVANVFPDAPQGAAMLAVCTYQAVPPLGTIVFRPAQVCS